MLINDYFSGNGSSTWYCLTGTPVSPSQIVLTVDGSQMYYGQNFVVTGEYYVGFIDPPPVGQDNIHAEYEGTPNE